MVTKPISDSNEKHVQLLKAALSLRQGGESTAALSLLEKAIQSKPDFLLAHIFLGLTYQSLNRNREAEKAFRSALMIDPNSQEALQSLGLLLLSQDRFPEALAYLMKHLQLDPGNAATLDVVIPALSKAERLEEAEEILSSAWEKTKDADIARRYARFLLSMQQVEKAQHFLEKAIDVSATPHLLVELALALVIEQKYKEAIDVLQRALKLRPDYDRALRGLAHCYTQLNNGEKALEMADRALAVDPNHYRNWQAKGDALLLQKRYEEAAEASQTGIDLIEEEDAEALPVLGVLYLQKYHALLHTNDVTGALQTMEFARQAAPDDERFYLYPAQILIQINRPDEAFELIHEVKNRRLLNQEQMDGFLQAIASLGIEIYARGNSGVAKEVFEHLVQLIPCESRFCTALGYILIGEGKLEQAEEYFQRELDAENGESKGILNNDLGFIHLLQNRLDEAGQDLKAALESEEVEAFLRVAFYHSGKIVPDYAPHPSRQTTSHRAARASLVALSLLQNDLNSAQSFVEEMKSDALEDPLTLEVWGCVLAAQGNWDKAREVWEQAMRFAQDSRVKQMLLDWFTTIPG